jgi:hypothetical protein
MFDPPTLDPISPLMTPAEFEARVEQEFRAMTPLHLGAGHASPDARG